MKKLSKSSAFWLVLFLSQCIIASCAPLRKRIDLRSTSRDDHVQAAVEAPMSNEQLEAYLKEYATRCSAISRLISIGKSVDGFPLYVLEISNNPGVAEGKPNVKLVGNIHGDETLGRTLTVGLAEYLCGNYKTDSTAKRIVDGSHLYVMPSLNPDGYAAKSRFNANGVDLNRDFPDHFKYPTCAPTGNEQPETTAMMNWSQKIPFVSSLAFHGGTYVVNYPWDGTRNGAVYYNACPDDKTFVDLSKTYAKYQSNILNGGFPDGITNGADWYVIYGSMQDWNYVRTGCMELTVEVGPKTPPNDDLASMFDDNLKPMLQFITKSAFGGVSGKVTAMVGTKMVPVQADIIVKGISRVSKSGAKFGDYYRPLASGQYTITIFVQIAVGKDVLPNIKSTQQEFDTNRKILQKNDPVQNVLKHYPENMVMQDHLKEFVSRCSSISRLKSIGKSTKGFNIWAIEISDKPGRGEAEPHVKLVGNLHGDEPTGRALTMALAEWLCKNYETDEDAKHIVNDVHLWLVPSMNPDGFTARKRENINGKDLNRNFPDRFIDPSMEPTGEEEAETAVMMKWSLTQHFVASLAFHEGALVANYPFDGTADKKTRYEACPDDETFKYLASTYAKSHANMSVADNEEFPGAGGITNGAAWYPIQGSMQDWNYLRAGCMEVTLEVSESKWPPESVLPQLFKDNLPAMLSYIKVAALGGVRGKVVVESNTVRKDKGKEMHPVEANVTIEGSDFVVKSNSVYGDYYRPLAPGKYTVVVRREGYPTARSNITVPEDGTGVIRDFVLRQKKLSSNDVVLSSVVQRQHNLVLIGSGVGIMWGLWLVHRQMIYRSLYTVRQRSM